MSRLHRLPTLGLAGSLLLACDQAPATCEAPPASWRAISFNSTELNGTYLGNGVQLQGTRSPDVRLEAVRLHDARFPGVHLQRGRIVDSDGEPIADETARGVQLLGRLSDGREIELELGPPRTADGRTYYRLHADGANVCGDGIDGLFVPGAWDETATRHPGADGWFTYSCSTGVIAKCVAWGYDPDVVGPDVHQSCTRMARADYCGDGTSHTRNGTLIDVIDAREVAKVAGGEDALEFEAAWSPDGAMCVNRPRYDTQIVGVGEVLPECWRALPRCESLAEAHALEPAVRLANRSVPQPRLLCEAP